MLLDKYMPEFQYNEIHKTLVHASTREAFLATKNIQLSKSTLIAILFTLRGLPIHSPTLQDTNHAMRFTLLDEIHYSEFLYGFWFSTKTEWVAHINEFVRPNPNYNAKAVWSFCFNQKADGTTEIQTETRVFCQNKTSLVLFSIYWFFIKPFSGLVRTEILKLVKNELEQKKQR